MHTGTGPTLMTTGLDPRCTPRGKVSPLKHWCRMGYLSWSIYH